MIKSISLMFSICILVRLLLVFIVYTQSYKNLISLVYGVITLGLAYQYVKNERKLGAFGQKVWWQNFRLFHVLVYSTIIFMIQNNYSISLIVSILLFDLLIAILGHIYYNYF